MTNNSNNLLLILTLVVSTATPSSSFLTPSLVAPPSSSINKIAFTNGHQRQKIRRTKHELKMSLISSAVQVNDLVANNSVVMFGVSDETQTTRIKNLFDSENVRYTSVDVDLLPNGVDVMSAINHMTGHTIVPVIYIDGGYIGGHDHILAMNMDGYLGEILEHVGALPEPEMVKIKEDWGRPRTEMAMDDAGLF